MEPHKNGHDQDCRDSFKSVCSKEKNADDNENGEGSQAVGQGTKASEGEEIEENNDNDSKFLNVSHTNDKEIPSFVVSNPYKRQGDYLTKDDFTIDDEEEKQEVVVGSFQKASKEVLMTRRILKVARNEGGQYESNKKNEVENLSKASVYNPFGSIPRGSESNVAAATITGTASVVPAAVFGASTSFLSFGTASSNTSNFGFGFGASTAKNNSVLGSDGATSGNGFIVKSSSVSSNAVSFGGFGSIGSGMDSVPPDDGIARFFDTTTYTSPALPAPASSSFLLPTDYEVRSGEEDEIVLFCKRCKTYRLGPGNVITSSISIGKDDANPSVPPSAALSTINQSLVSELRTDDDKTASGAGVSDATRDGNEVADNDDKAHSDSQAPTKTWHEVGTGPLKVLQTKDRNKRSRLVQRRESTPGGSATTVILNLRLQQNFTKIEMPAEKHVRVAIAAASSTSLPMSNVSFSTTGKEDIANPGPSTSEIIEGSIENASSQPQPGIFLFKFKLASEAYELSECLQRIVLPPLATNEETDQSFLKMESSKYEK